MHSIGDFGVAQAGIHSQGIGIPKIRLIAITCALAFIPAFAYGWTVVWTPVCAIAVGFLFRSGLKHIIAGYAGMEDPKAVVRHIYKRLPLLVLECAAVTAVPQLVAGWLYVRGILAWDGLLPAGAPDALTGFYKWFFPSIFEKYPEIVLDAQKMIAADVYGFSIVLFFALFIITMKPSWAVLNRLMYKRVVSVPTTKLEQKKYGQQYAHYEALGFVFVMLAVVFCLLQRSGIQSFVGGILKTSAIPTEAIIISSFAPFVLIVSCFLSSITAWRSAGRSSTEPVSEHGALNDNR